MSVVGFASVAGSPGVTTTAVGVWLAWPRAAMLVEADTHALSAVLPGLLRGKYDNTRNLSQAMLLHARGELTARDLLDPTLPLTIALHELPPDTALPHPVPPSGQQRWLLAAFDDLDAAAGSPALWSQLALVGTQLQGVGVDLLIDFGRLTRPDSRRPLLERCEALLIVTSNTLPNLFRTAIRVEELRGDLAAIGPVNARLVLIGSGREVTAEDFRAACGIPVTGTLPFSPRAAAEYSTGLADRRRTPYKTAISRLAHDLHATLTREHGPAGATHA